MRECAAVNLVSLAVLSTLAAFAGCGGSPAPETPASEAAPPAAATAGQQQDADPSAGADPASPAAAGGDTQPAAGSAEAGGVEASKSTECPLDSASGDDAPKTAGVAGQDRSMETIQKIVLAHRGCVRRCYEEAREKLPDLKGDMTIRFVVKPDGKLAEAEVNMERSQIFAPALVNCAVGVLEKLSYGESSKGMETTINYPFNFNP